MVGEQKIGTSESGLMILRQTLGPTSEFYNYIENNNNDLKLIDLKGIDSQTASILLFNTVLPLVRFIKI